MDEPEHPASAWSMKGLWQRWNGGVWQRREFRKLWSAQTVSQFGTMVSAVAIPWVAILELDASPLQLSVLGVSGMVPGFLVGLFAGAWVDRLSRRTVMIVADFARAILLLLIPLMALVGQLSLPLLFVVAAGVSFFSVFFDVAYRAILPSILPPEEVLEGNSRLSASASVSEAAGFSIGGWLVQLASAPGAVFIDALSFIWSVGWLRKLRVDERVKTVEEREPILDEIRDGLQLVWRNQTLRGLAGYSLTFDLAFNMFGVVFLLYVSETLGFSTGLLGVIFALGGISSVGGAAIAGRVTSALGVRTTFVMMSFIMAVGQGSTALATSAGLLAAGILIAQQFLVDAPATIVDINSSTIRQLSASEAWQGRINATFRVLSFGGSIIGMVAGGIIGEWIGLRAVIVISALLVACGSFWVKGLGEQLGEVHDV